MLERYSHIRMAAKRTAVEAFSTRVVTPENPLERRWFLTRSPRESLHYRSGRRFSTF